jgi:hypothetical protein
VPALRLDLLALAGGLRNRFDYPNDAEGQHLAGDKEAGEIYPHLRFPPQGTAARETGGFWFMKG